MRDAREWAKQDVPLFGADFAEWIRAIQSDAARGERERCAVECERICKEASDFGVASRYQHVREVQGIVAQAFGAVAATIRALPDANAPLDAGTEGVR